MKIKTTKVNELSKGKKATVKLSKSLTKKLKEKSMVLSVIDSPEHSLMVFSARTNKVKADTAESTIMADEAFYKIIQVLSGNPYEKDDYIPLLESEIDTLLNENKELKESIKRLESENDKLKKESSTKNSELVDSHAVVDNVEKLTSEVSKLSECNKKLVDENDALSKKCDELEDSNKKLLESLRTTNSDADFVSDVIRTFDEGKDEVYVQSGGTKHGYSLHLTDAHSAAFGLMIYKNKLFVKVKGTNNKGYNVYSVLETGVTLYEYANSQEPKYIKKYADINVISLEQIDLEGEK